MNPVLPKEATERVCLFGCKFYLFSDGAAFAATATQEDNLLGGGSLSDAGLPGGSARNMRSVGATIAAQTNMDIDRVLKADNG